MKMKEQEDARRKWVASANEVRTIPWVNGMTGDKGVYLFLILKNYLLKS